MIKAPDKKTYRELMCLINAVPAGESEEDRREFVTENLWFMQEALLCGYTADEFYDWLVYETL